MKNYINKEYYRKIVEKFKQETISLWDCGYPYGPFIPYVFPTYMQAEKRFFYIGRDTYGWTSVSDFLKNDIDTYMDINADAVDVNLIQEFKNGSFFFFVIQLHICLLKGYIINRIDDLTNEDIELLKNIGYGNLNAVELAISLNNEGYDIDYNKYDQIKESAHQLEKIKDIINAYNPDCIFIFNWQEREDVFEGLEVTWKKEFYQDQKISVYVIDGCATKIIWCSHPTRLKFLGINNQTMIDMIMKTYQKCMI